MKVLQCIHSLSGGGAERQISYLAGQLKERGWSVVTALMHGGPNMQRHLDGGAGIEWLRAAGNRDPRLVWAVRRLLRAERPDLVHSWLHQMDIIVGFAAFGSGVPWLMSERSSGDAFRANWQDRLRLMMAKRATAIVANSADGARFWRLHAPKVPVHVIANALDLEAIDAAEPVSAEAMGVEEGQRIVLAVGRLSPEKNQRLLIEALPQLEQDVVVVICGQGPLLEATRALARELGVADRVRFPGYVDSIWSWLKRADAFVSIGWYEGHPNAVMEAMAARCPAVLSDIEAHREVLGREEALFVDPSSSADLASAIRTMLNSDVEARLQRARARAETFSIEAAGAAYDALYREVAAVRR